VDRFSLPMKTRLNILIVYVMNKYPLRATLWDHLYCYRQYSDDHCFYLNLSVRSVPWYLHHVKFDLIIFDTLFLANRIKPEWFDPVLEKARALKNFPAVKVALPQDEHSHSRGVTDFFSEFGVETVFSVGAETQWSKLYPEVDFDRVKFFRVLTGYLSGHTVRRLSKLGNAATPRDITVGYRTWQPGPWLGRHGLLRKRIGDVFLAQAARRGFTHDISTEARDVLWGDDWFRFLLRCKYAIGVEGGSSVFDEDGSVQQSVEAYQRAHPDAGFEEIEKACFPGLDGSLNYVALSPRHLECCATRTCQVLIEGDYNGILQPGKHYLELKRDFSNLEQVMDQMSNDNVRSEITERAYRDIVASGNYTYRHLVDTVVNNSLPGRDKISDQSLTAAAIYYWMRVSEAFSWVQVALHLHSFVPRFKRLVRRRMPGLFPNTSIE
jgi:hypothetical protein